MRTAKAAPVSTISPLIRVYIRFDGRLKSSVSPWT
jgi:hypothetical protein